MERVFAIVAAAQTSLASLACNEGRPDWSDRRRNRWGIRGRVGSVNALVRRDVGRNDGRYAGRDASQRGQADAGGVVAVCVARPAHHAGVVAWVLLAAIVGAMLAVFTSLAVMSRKPAEAADPRLAAPAEVPIERSSMIPAVQIVSDGGW